MLESEPPMVGGSLIEREVFLPLMLSKTAGLRAEMHRLSAGLCKARGTQVRSKRRRPGSGQSNIRNDPPKYVRGCGTPSYRSGYFEKQSDAT
jgi:hypothetical protein